MTVNHAMIYGGGGGTYIVKDVENPKIEDIIVIAGGSGWYDQKDFNTHNLDINLLENVKAKLYNYEAGYGGGGYKNDYGTGGGGFNGNGQDLINIVTYKGGSSYMDGSGEAGGIGGWTAGAGGYGGGGQSGGGGGYTGGNAGNYAYSNGGTSYNNFDTTCGDVDYKYSIDGGFASIELITIITEDEAEDEEC